MFVRSLHFKVTAWYTLALSAIILIFSTFTYQNFKHNLFKNLDSFLNSEAESVGDLIDSRRVDGRSFLDATTVTIQEEDDEATFMQVLGPQGKRLFYSNKDMAGIIPAVVINNAVLQGNIQIETLKKFPIRVITMPILENGKIAYIIQVGETLIPIYDKLHKLKKFLYLFLPLALFFAVFIGLFLTRMALNPVDKIAHTMRQINAKNLQEKIHLPNAANEVKVLADTFNDMLARLDRSFSAQKQFIQDISHELKTPLTAMRGKQEVALTKERSAKEYQSVLEINLEAIDKMSRLVENLLVLISVDSKEKLLNIGTIDLSVLINRVLNNMMPLAQQKQISLKSSLQEGIIIKGDDSQISRVVLNLLDNAIKYTPINGHVGVTLYKENGLAKIVITDTGLGIGEKELPRIFDRFYRADQSRNTPGFGLGLSIAKSIIDAHQGNIEVESQIGRKTTFTVSLPFNFPDL